MSDEALLTGRHEPPAGVRRLHAGPVACVLDGIELRDIRRGGVELANLVYVAIRDERWNTVPALVSELDVTTGPDWFRVSFRARHLAGDLDLSWDGRIRGDGDGTISYTLDATAATSFRYNRIGCNILHSVTAVAGRPYQTSRGDDGLTHDGIFPVAIAPQAAVAGRLTGMLAPFRRMTVDLGSGVQVVIVVAGDEFETEDQRNFADATFKTYSTPLQRPAPFSATAGTRLAQSVAISVIADAPLATGIGTGSADRMVRVAIGDVLPGRLPGIGLGVASDGVPMDPREVSTIAGIRPAHLRVVIDAPAGMPGASQRLTAAVADALALDAELEVELRLGPNGSGLDAAADLLAGTPARVARVLVHAPSDGPIDSGTPASIVLAVRQRLAAVLPSATVGALVSNLSALLREHVDGSALGSVGLPMCPTIHRDDDRTVMENVLGLDDQVATTGRAIGGRPVHVGPVTLASVGGPWPGGATRSSGLPPQVDVRQPSLFTAAWTVGALSSLLASGAASLTMFETCGWRGVIERTHGMAATAAFLSRPSATFPVWHVLADLAAHVGGTSRRVEVDDPSRVAALAVSSAAGSLILVANLTREPVGVDLVLGDGPGSRLRLRTLDETTAAAAMDDPRAFRRTGAGLPTTPTVQVPLTAYAIATLATRMTPDGRAE